MISPNRLSVAKTAHSGSWAPSLASGPRAPSCTWTSVLCSPHPPGLPKVRLCREAGLEHVGTGRSVTYSQFVKLGSLHHSAVLEHSVTPKRSFLPLSCRSPLSSPSLPTPDSHSPTSCLDMSHQWNRTPCGLVCPASLTERCVFAPSMRGECHRLPPFHG